CKIGNRRHSSGAITVTAKTITKNIIQPTFNVQVVCIIIAGIALILKILGEAQISWEEILLIATFPIWLSLTIIVGLMALVLVILAICAALALLFALCLYVPLGLIWGFESVKDFIGTALRNLKRNKKSVKNPLP